MNVAGWADENLRRFGDYEGLVIGDRAWTNAVLHERACRLASALLALGVEPGERVVLLLPNSIEMVVAFAATVRSGAVAVPLFAGASAAEIERIVALAAPAAVVASAEIARAAHAALNGVRVRIAAASEAPPEWADLGSLVDGHAPLATAVAREAADAAVICYTSGTSGAPKGVVHTHGSVHARHGGGTRRLAARILVALPLGTLGAGMLTGRFAHQWTLILQERFEPRAFLAAIERYRVTKLVMVPSMGEALAALPDLASYDLTSLRSVGFTGADVPPALLAKLAAVMPVNPSVAYGMTETGGGIAATGLASKPGSVGRILKGVEVRIVGERGEDLPCGEAGEIHVRTPWMGAGYYRQPDETAAAFAGGWIRTGDLGYVDEDRELFLVGRRKDLIIQSGVKVAPRDVVEVLRRLDGVDECAAVGVPHAVLGEAVVACIVRKAQSRVSEDEVLAHCRAHLDPRKVPVRVSFRDALPKTQNHKVNVQALRDELVADEASVVETDLVRRLRSAVAAERMPLLIEAVRDALVRLAPPRQSANPAGLDSTATFGELGLDSLRLAQLGHALGRALGRSIAPTLFFSHPTVDAVCRHLVAEIAQPEPPVAARRAGRVPAREPVAIVGLGCRLPGGANTPDEFWSLLRRGIDATADISRWNVDALYDPTRGAPGKIYTRRAALLDAPELFDAEFFGVTTREALRLDPQHRLALEVTWEALEHAGYDPSSLSQSVAGLFLGISSASSVAGGGLGGAPSMAVGRLCHFLDLRGPAVAVDTSCSSSLAAIHNAVQSLRLGECDVALAGGVQLIGSLRTFVGLSEMSLMAADGRCKAFDASADGFGRGEGCVMIVLKRLADAEADGDRVIAVVRGSAVRHDGRSSSLTAPNGRAQQEVIRAALEDGRVEPKEVGYLEAHGTGTALGDPIEVEAAMAVLGDPARPLVIGSVKTNIGHLETAAGAAGLMKVALALEHGEIPAHLHCRTLNPLIEPLASKFAIPGATQPWARPTGRRRIGGVTSMGLSGTNVHVVVEEAAPAPARAEDAASQGAPLHLVCVSARTDGALREQARRYAEHFSSVAPGELADHAFTANAGRAHFARRLAVLARRPADVVDQLAAYARGAADAVRTGAAAKRPKVAFLFPGCGAPFPSCGAPFPSCGAGLQPCTPFPDCGAAFPGCCAPFPGCGAPFPGCGAPFPSCGAAFPSCGAGLQPCDLPIHPGAGRELYETEPAFRRALQRCAEVLQPLLPRPLLGVLYPDAPHAAQADAAVFTDAALFAIEWSLSELWKSWGVEPDVVCGVGVGECVAACAAGVITLEDGLKLAVARGGSGLEQVAGGMRCSPLRVRLVSSLTGGPVSPDELSQAGHWVRQRDEPARFAAAMATLAAEGCQAFVEAGPGAALLEEGRACLADAAAGCAWLPSLGNSIGECRPANAEERRDREHMLAALAGMYVRGLTPDWRGFYTAGAFRRVALPTYPFERKRYRYRLAEARGADAAAPQRSARQQTLRARLQAEASERRLEEISDAVRQQVAEILERPAESLSVHDNCLELGLDSLGVLDVVTAIRQRAGIACTPADFVSRATIAEFASFVSARVAATRHEAEPPKPSPAEPPRHDARVVPLNDRGPRAPLFCMHPSGGQVTAYLRLRNLLGDEHPVYAVQSRALRDPEREHASIESMAAEYAALVRSVRPGGPYRLLGWSMGGLIALAVAAELERCGAAVELVGLIDVAAPAPRATPADLAFALSAIAADVHPAGGAAAVTAADLEALDTIARADLLSWCEAQGRIPAGALTGDAFDAMLRLYERHFQLVREHRPPLVHAPIVEWRAASRRRPYRWSRHSRVGAVEKIVGGTHFSVMQPPHIERIAADLLECEQAHLGTRLSTLGARPSALATS